MVLFFFCTFLVRLLWIIARRKKRIVIIFEFMLQYFIENIEHSTVLYFRGRACHIDHDLHENTGLPNPLQRLMGQSTMIHPLILSVHGGIPSLVHNNPRNKHWAHNMQISEALPESRTMADIDAWPFTCVSVEPCRGDLLALVESLQWSYDCLRNGVDKTEPPVGVFSGAW